MQNCDTQTFQLLCRFLSLLICFGRRFTLAFSLYRCALHSSSSPLRWFNNNFDLSLHMFRYGRFLFPFLSHFHAYSFDCCMYFGATRAVAACVRACMSVCTGSVFLSNKRKSRTAGTIPFGSGEWEKSEPVKGIGFSLHCVCICMLLGKSFQ